MADQSLRRADQLLTDLVEQVETARAMPMSSSCVVPRERMLDMLDELREALPSEITEARGIIAARDHLLHEAYATASASREKAEAEAERLQTSATARAGELVHAAEVRAHEIVEDAKRTHADLVSATSVHAAAAEAAAQLQREAQTYRSQTVGDADRYAAQVRAEADRHAAQLAADSLDYADRTLFELVATLQRAAATAEQGRHALAERRSQAGDASDDLSEYVDDPAVTGTLDPVAADSVPVPAGA